MLCVYVYSGCGGCFYVFFVPLQGATQAMKVEKGKELVEQTL